MADLTELFHKPVQAQPEHSWSHSLVEYYHAGLKMVGLEKDEPKPAEPKKFELSHLDLKKFEQLNPPGEMIFMEHDIYKSEACRREFYSKALPDPKHLDMSCFDSNFKHTADNRHDK